MIPGFESVVTSIRNQEEMEMKINYEFVDGNKVEIEVSEEWASVVIELDRVEYNNNQTETRRHISLDTFNDKSKIYHRPKGMSFIRVDGRSFRFDDPRIKGAIDSLTEKQRDLVIKVYFDGMTAREYAKRKGISEKTASHTHIRALRNIKKYFEEIF